RNSRAVDGSRPTGHARTRRTTVRRVPSVRHRPRGPQTGPATRRPGEPGTRETGYAQNLVTSFSAVTNFWVVWLTASSELICSKFDVSDASWSRLVAES